MFDDPRWGDDPRDRDDGARDLSRGSRGGSDPRERERVEPRDVFVDRVNLPRGPEREHVRFRDRDYTLRGSESRTLASVGAFRVVPAHDLRDTVRQAPGPAAWRAVASSRFRTRRDGPSRPRHNRRHADQGRTRPARIPSARRRTRRIDRRSTTASRSRAS